MEILRSTVTESLSHALVVGINDNQLCRDGWHERAVDGRSGILYRPMAAEATFQLALPGGDLEIVALVSASTTLCGGLMKAHLLLDENPLAKTILDTENWVIRRFPLKQARAGLHLFKWIVEDTFIPNDVLKNGDFRKMGLYMACVRVQKTDSQGD